MITIKDIKRMDNKCHIPDLVHAFSYVENGGLNLAKRTALYHDIDTDGRLQTKIYDKRFQVNILIINFPILSRNILSATSYGFYISQLKRHARICPYYTDINQCYEEEKFK